MHLFIITWLKNISSGTDQPYFLLSSKSAAPSSSPDATEHRSEAIATEHCNDTEELQCIDNLVVLLSAAAEDFAPNLPQLDVDIQVVETVMQWGETEATTSASFDRSALLCHNKTVSIVLRYARDDSGEFKSFLSWARRVVSIRDDVIRQMGRIATEHADMAGTSIQDNATELVDAAPVLSEVDVIECYKRIGIQMLRNDLLPHQEKNSKYKIKREEDGSVSLSQTFSALGLITCCGSISAQAR
jgi:hypothetical protein